MTLIGWVIVVGLLLAWVLVFWGAMLPRDPPTRVEVYEYPEPPASWASTQPARAHRAHPPLWLPANSDEDQL